MKKKIYAGIVIVMIVLVGNLYLILRSSHENMSAVALANVEALAQDESGGGSREVKSVIITDLGTGTDCVNNVLYDVSRYSVNCIGDGKLPCTSGIYEKYTARGKCSLV